MILMALATALTFTVILFALPIERVRNFYRGVFFFNLLLIVINAVFSQTVQYDESCNIIGFLQVPAKIVAFSAFVAPPLSFATMAKTLLVNRKEPFLTVLTGVWTLSLLPLGILAFFTLFTWVPLFAG